MTDPSSVRGDYLGVEFPTTLENLRDQGADFLTEAFRATGALSPQNRVHEITEFSEFFGGGAARKILLSVVYEDPDPSLDTTLFVKCPFDFEDPRRELYKAMMDTEVHFALFSRRHNLPITVPSCYFAEYHAGTSSGLLITDRVSYGQGRIEPFYDKCLDYQLPHPFEHYEAMTKAMARLAGHAKSGPFGAAVDAEFPFDLAAIKSGTPISYSAHELQGKLDDMRWFVQSGAHLLPSWGQSLDFVDAFAEDVRLVVQHQETIRNYLNGRREYISLCHFNMNIDNAWFWHDEAGELHAGVLDWALSGKMNVGQGLWGMVLAAETDFVDAHMYDLITVFVDEYRRSGGPMIDAEELLCMFKLSMTIVGTAWMLHGPSQLANEVPDLRKVKDRHDPVLESTLSGRGWLQSLTMLLNEWHHQDVGGALRKVIGQR